MNLTVKKINSLKENEIKCLDEFVDNSLIGMHFHKYEWLFNIYPNLLEVVNESFVVYDNNSIVALYPLFISKRKKLFQKLAYSSPFFSAYPIFELSLNDKKLFLLIKYISGYINNFENVIVRLTESSYQKIKFPIYRLQSFKNIETTISHQVVFLPSQKDQILKLVEGKFRTTLKKVNIEKFQIKEVITNGLNDKYLNKIVDCNINATYQKTGIKKQDKVNILNHFKTLLSSCYSKLFCVMDSENIVSYALIFIYKDYAYYSEAYTLRDKKYYGVNNLLQFHIMEYLIDNKISYYDLGVYDLNIDDELKNNIYKFKRSMGAKLVFSEKSLIATNKFINLFLSKLIKQY